MESLRTENTAILTLPDVDVVVEVIGSVEGHVADLNLT